MNDNSILTFNERSAAIRTVLHNEKTQINDRLRMFWDIIKIDVRRDVIRILGISEDLASQITDITCPYYHFTEETTCEFYLCLTIDEFEYYIRCDYNDTNNQQDYIISTDNVGVGDFRRIGVTIADQHKVIRIDGMRSRSGYVHPSCATDMKESCTLIVRDLIMEINTSNPNPAGSKLGLWNVFKTIRRLADRYYNFPIFDTKRSVLLILAKYRESTMCNFPRDIVLMICKLAMTFDR